MRLCSMAWSVNVLLDDVTCFWCVVVWWMYFIWYRFIPFHSMIFHFFVSFHFVAFLSFSFHVISLCFSWLRSCPFHSSSFCFILQHFLSFPCFAFHFIKGLGFLGFGLEVWVDGLRLRDVAHLQSSRDCKDVEFSLSCSGCCFDVCSLCFIWGLEFIYEA